MDLSKSLFQLISRLNPSLAPELIQQLQDFKNQIELQEHFWYGSVEDLFPEMTAQSKQISKSNLSFKVLDYRRIKESLKVSKDVGYICALLQALRWRISRAENVMLRREAVIQLTSNNMLDHTLFGSLFEKKSRNINEHLISLVNTLASEYLGRSYLIENTQLIKNLIHIMKSETKDTFLRRNCLGILQKLSLRKRPQEILIEMDIVKWAVSVLVNERSLLSDYSLEYLSALVLNLSLRTIGKDKFEEIKYSVMGFLSEFLQHDNIDIRTYVNGTMYSLFTRASIKKLAIEMGFEEKLGALIQTSDEAFSKRYSYILGQLKRDSIETNLSELNEDENDMDLLDEEEFWAEEENENAPEVDFTLRGEDLLKEFKLEGDAADRQYQIVSAIMEETISQSKLELTKGHYKNLKDEGFPRPSTPFKMQQVFSQG